MAKLNANKACRRCSECVGAVHHWLENDDFGFPSDAYSDRPEATGNEYVCKHCPAVGDACEVCNGTGGHSDPDNKCPCCKGDGIVSVSPMTFEKWEDLQEGSPGLPDYE